MNPEEFWAEAWRLVAEYDSQRPDIIKEYRLYHNEDGTIIGLWESGHPDGDNYIVLDDPDIFHRTNTALLIVANKKLKILDPTKPNRVRLQKSNTGQMVVKGHAAIALNEKYHDIEYYEYTNY
ncbi:hypothetical protein UFOVP257_428 [uncultured Caudovirales phage]|uniref:Uncharacterized protein n=1 Tax=uncultured Caudovirales phage TaxID=2100421 RepID=A0A6J5LKR5_9CAUD|nr:hypothetical protein UFOVP257_428 [uncultured Caudovirales phage]